MDWYHKTSYEWLDARRAYLTASDIQKLLPITPNGRPRSPASIEEAQRAVWAVKQCAARIEDCESRGVMARGHLLEPFAINDLNDTEFVSALDLSFHHWDDAVIHSADKVSFSPDSLSVPQLSTYGVDVHRTELEPLAMAEVKAYNGSSHYESGFVIPKLQLPERWQVATAMYVCPSIELGLLVFYNPGAKHKMFIRSFKRAELALELTKIEHIASEYWTAAAHLDSTADSFYSSIGSPDCMDEESICKALIDQQSSCPEGLNP